MMNWVCTTATFTRNGMLLAQTLIGLLCIVPSALGQNTTTALPRSAPGSGESQVGFRLDVDIYVDETKPPIAQYKTLFTDNQAIDLDAQGNRVVILDYSNSSLTVLDSKARTQTNLELAGIDAMLKDALAQASSTSDSAPSRDSNNQLIIGDETVQYQVKTDKPAASLLATRYADFADATTKIAAIFPPYKPPQLRLELNKILRDTKELPMVTTRITTANGGTSTITARMLIKPQLDAEDKKDIQIANGYLNQYKHLSSSDFFGTK